MTYNLKESRERYAKYLTDKFAANPHGVQFPDQASLIRKLERWVNNKTVEETYTTPPAGEESKTLGWSNKQVRRVYTQHMRKVVSNLFTNPNSLYVQQSLRDEILTPRDVVYSPPWFLLSPETIAERQKQMEEDIRDNHTAYVRLASKQQGMFKCGRCKSDRTSYTEVQTRSADEGMTAFVLCDNCGNKWKC
jgi:DNA-directed RNA polymerase subunit M/transcription elongation factor TFIIS